MKSINWGPVIVSALAAYGLLVTVVILGCERPAPAPAAAEAAYGAELLRCVDKATTLAESKACRAEVNVRWGVTEVEAGR